MKAAEALATYVGVKPACDALRVARATFYRRRRPSTGHQQPRRRTPARALSEKERDVGLRHAVFGAISVDSARRRPPRLWRPCSTKTSCTCAANVRCIAFWPPKCQFESAERSGVIPNTRNPRCDGDGPGPGLIVLGFHTAAVAEEVELLLPLRHGPAWTSSAVLHRGMEFRSADRESSALAGRLHPSRRCLLAWRPAPGPDLALGSRSLR